MPKSRLKDPCRFIIRYSDGSSFERVMEYIEAKDRFEFYVNADIEFQLKTLVSLAIVFGTHVRHYYASNHHKQHVSLIQYER